MMYEMHEIDEQCVTDLKHTIIGYHSCISSDRKSVMNQSCIMFSQDGPLPKRQDCVLQTTEKVDIDRDIPSSVSDH